jgi:hypothetical protein
MQSFAVNPLQVLQDGSQSWHSPLGLTVFPSWQDLQFVLAGPEHVRHDVSQVLHFLSLESPKNPEAQTETHLLFSKNRGDEQVRQYAGDDLQVKQLVSQFWQVLELVLNSFDWHVRQFFDKVEHVTQFVSHFWQDSVESSLKYPSGQLEIHSLFIKTRGGMHDKHFLALVSHVLQFESQAKQRVKYKKNPFSQLLQSLNVPPLHVWQEVSHFWHVWSVVLPYWSSGHLDMQIFPVKERNNGLVQDKHLDLFDKSQVLQFPSQFWHWNVAVKYFPSMQVWQLELVGPLQVLQLESQAWQV